jgi:adenylate kinase
MRLILIGPPGSGKGTQARLLHQRLELANIGTGDILREAIRLGTPAGQRAEPFVSSGKLVPDDLVNELVADLFRRDGRPERFVMDGYPRTLAQAHAFDQLLRQQFLDLQAAVVLIVHDEEIVRRITGRRVCPNCHATYHLAMKPPRVPNLCDVCQSQLVHRQDDSEDTIRKRLDVYHRNTRGLIDHYRKNGLLREVPGEGNVEEIYTQVAQSCRKPASGS